MVAILSRIFNITKKEYLAKRVNSQRSNDSEKMWPGLDIIDSVKGEVANLYIYTAHKTIQCIQYTYRHTSYQRVVGTHPKTHRSGHPSL